MAGTAWSDLAKLHLEGQKTAFMAGLQRAPTQWPSIAVKVPSNQKIETYPWLVWPKGPQRWKDEREPGGATEHYLQVENYDYETSWKVWRDALRYEKYGQLTIQATGKGAAFATYIDNLMMSLIAAAPTTASYTGDAAPYVADTGHEEGNSGSQDNLSTAALDADSLTAARVLGMNLKGADGEPLNIRYDTIIVPAALEEIAFKLVFSDRQVGNAQNDANIHQGRYRILVNPYMTDTTDWALMDTSQFIMPLMWQEVQGPSSIDIIEDKLKKAKYVVYGSDMTGRASFTLWQLLHYAQVSGG